MTQDPTPYDLLQDQAIGDLQDIVTPYYTPPGDAEYSFPVVGQGITADQYRQMSLAQGDGIIHRGYRPYYLEGHATSAETNQRNTLILKVDGQHDYSESIIGGFYHRLTGNMELDFPPVTTSTDYHVCVTYDPRRENEETGPAHIEVYAGEPPRTHGRQHNILNVVRREPNQLLSDATITRYRQATAPTIFVQNPSQLPNPADVLYGTTAFTHTGLIFISLGSSWHEIADSWKPGPWQSLPIHSSYGWTGSAHWREELDGIRIVANLSGGNRLQMAQLPPGYVLNRPWYGFAYKAAGDGAHGISVDSGSRNVELRDTGYIPSFVRFDQFISGYYF